jgi:hypothetical protein
MTFTSGMKKIINTIIDKDNCSRRDLNHGPSEYETELIMSVTPHVFNTFSIAPK